MSCVALAKDAAAINPTTQAALADEIPSNATPAVQASTMDCIGTIQLRRRPADGRQRLSTCGAHRNLSTPGKPTSGSQARVPSPAPSRRSSVGNASIATPSGIPWEKYRAAIMMNKRPFANRFTVKVSYWGDAATRRPRAAGATRRAAPRCPGGGPAARRFVRRRLPSGSAPLALPARTAFRRQRDGVPRHRHARRHRLPRP
ncbi:hypothetical protein G6F68_014888 [Rhizopus microsporus]|nr:hypothetical protein G6F68_014888 [Rhizopus microsporus]